MDFSDFVVLYSETKIKKIRVWKIKVVEENTYSTIVTESGEEGGKLVEFKVRITKGKNIGKANETDHYEQAVSEATYKFNKKIDEGYSFDKNNLRKLLLPMLATNYRDRSKDITFPCFVQPKIDGIRAVYSEGQLFTRTGKKFPHLENILLQLKDVPEDIVLDGEIYSDKITFEEISGLCRKEKLNDEDIKISSCLNFMVFDIIDKKLDFFDRYTFLEDFFKENSFKNIKLVECYTCKSDDEIKKFFEKFIKEGYEGIMLRNYIGKYTLKYRSKNLQKFKEFMDSEYKIVGFTSGVGSEKDAVIWICENKKGAKFNVRPKGTIKSRKEILKKADNYIGKLLTVKYFELTGDGIPRFPTTLYPDLGGISEADNFYRR